MLIPRGQFAQCPGVADPILAIPINQKKVEHLSQARAQEFFGSEPVRLRYLKDISLTAHPLDQDNFLGQAWGRPVGRLTAKSAGNWQVSPLRKLKKP